MYWFKDNFDWYLPQHFQNKLFLYTYIYTYTCIPTRKGTSHFLLAISLWQKAVRSRRLLLRSGNCQPDAQAQKLCPLVSNFLTFQLPPPSQFHHLQYNCSLQNQFYTKSCNGVTSRGSIRMPLHLQIWATVVPHQANPCLCIPKKHTNMQKPWCKAN